ncbi:SAM-dependent methyltransferase [Rhodoblastus acidophilus]|uniref:SAM-dependent methyltransferase n=1 Tax=Candidatus Rhodoblastus alkanivorans TaxID=2954117 RepID=A0ABS9Z9D7_9HYPH|nr:SAM-dependent methyltransferase [Candidatus Rhodoblastus alkanivorans]MCI4678885.1 SAM-dependent methyltransferase [Candidatus Rhodoblastus alkanivorans]MCI4684191.1 SAM-dependent methyltransferase [Candidatus Rhodoblastus alkanivorans]MDI4641512.1 SAM-dependent methyltransferase [Rhodoblastus acidophilus]
MTQAQERTLKEDIREIIADEGPISLERYMALALTHPIKGYYTTRNPFGADGDFITAPEISQMFGELIGLWAAEIWSQIGAPRHVRLVELGPGRGALMADALRAARAAPEFFAAVEVELIEASDLLAAQQSAALAASGKAASWRKSLDEVPPGPAIFIANEFFDALPVRHYLKTAEGWRERLVGLDPDGELAFGLSLEVEPYIKAEAPVGAVLEVGAAAQRLMTRIAARIVSEGGAALIIDYGYERTAFGETLQAVKAHQFVDPLTEPGLADLTTHVDFSALARAAASANALVHGPVEQGAFLTELGIYQRAEALKRNATAEQAAAVDSAVARLSGDGEGQMGALFKVLAATRRGLKEAPGFAPAGAA